ncbi:MAG: PEGA domain-containing protein [Limisphaerales bacterium]
MPWPLIDDYTGAVQNSQSAFNDPDLRNGQPELTRLGLPRPISGGFACVYNIQSSRGRWAARCFLSEISDQQQRYDVIDKHLKKVRLAHTVLFEYLPKGIEVKGKKYPLLKMEWVQGDSLSTFIEKNVNNPTVLRSLAGKWVKMLTALQATGIAHGDLQHGNILVVGGELRLIDYDGMFVPALSGRTSHEIGQKNYQHPARTGFDFGPQLDNFSAWMVYLSLVALATHPELWRKYNGGDECLLLRKEDFLNPSNSAVLRDLNNSGSNEIQALTEIFISFLNFSPLDVPPLDEGMIRKNIQEWELKNHQRILWQKRKRKIALAAKLSFATLCGLIALHFWLLSKTALSFEVSLDGHTFPANKGLNVTVDGKPFAAGDRITLGRHLIVAEFIGGEQFSRSIWTFYGKNNLGVLPLEASKGSLSVTVKPLPAKIIVEQDGKEIQQGDAPLKIDKLPVGDYSLLIRRGDYEESSAIKIEREQQTEANIILNIGSAQLSSEPPDAEFELSGNGKDWQGKLPIQIDNVPVGDYRFTVQRKGWELDDNLTVARGKLATDKIEFQYGSIEVTSDPTGLMASTNGVEIGKMPTTLRELKPGQYELTVSDGENDLMADVSVDPKETAKHAFVFRYGALQLSSTPLGATVIRKGKEIGKTPLTLEHVPAETTTVELRLDGFASTNFPVVTQEGLTASYTVKLFSKRYLAAMNDAQTALDGNQFELASNSVAIAIESDPTDSNAVALLAEITQKAEIWKQQQLEEERRAAQEKAKQLAALPMLNPQNIIKDCWYVPTKEHSATYDAAHSNPEAVPAAIATDIIVAGIKIIAWPFHKINAPKQPRFDLGHFYTDYQSKVYRYYGNIKSVDMDNQIIKFASGGKSKQSYIVSAHLSGELSANALVLKPGSPIWISGQLTNLQEANPANLLILENSTIYAPDTLPANK